VTEIPSSKELILLATTDFKNREERHHRHDQSSWVSGWITGFLSERKPNWSKLREEKVRKEERERVRKQIDIFCYLEASWYSIEKAFEAMEEEE
jgi:hypothetical protein